MNEIKSLGIGNETYSFVDEKARNEKLDNFNLSNKINVGSELLTDNTLWLTNGGWTGNAIDGFAHVVGQSTSLVYNRVIDANKSYVVEFDVETTEPSGQDGASNDFTVVLGDTEPIITYRGGGSMHYAIALKPTTSGQLQFLCRKHNNPYTEVSSFIGTIKNISLKEVTGNLAQTVIKDSNSNPAFEISIMRDENKTVAIGEHAGISNYSQKENVYIGSRAGLNDMTGYFNTGVGANSLQSLTTGSRNTAIGRQTLFNLTTGDRNTAIGSFAMSGNKTGRKNIAIGYDTMMSLTSGEDNIAIGDQAIISARNSTKNIGIGTGAMAGGVLNGATNNIAFGHASLYYNVSGSSNIGIGSNALYRNNSGSNNIGIGTASLNDMTDLRGMTAIGNNALNKVVTGGYSVGIGFDMNHGKLTNMERSIAIGSVLLNNLTSLNKSILLGYNVVASAEKTIENFVCLNSGRRTVEPKNNFVNIENSFFINTFEINKEKCGITVSNPTARLHIASQTTDSNTAPLKFTAGALMTYMEDGAFEYDGEHLYFTIGTERKTII